MQCWQIMTNITFIHFPLNINIQNQNNLSIEKEPIQRWQDNKMNHASFSAFKPFNIFLKSVALRNTKEKWSPVVFFFSYYILFCSTTTYVWLFSPMFWIWQSISAWQPPESIQFIKISDLIKTIDCIARYPDWIHTDCIQNIEWSTHRTIVLTTL